MAAHAAPNVWVQMNYVPPRGQCNFKQSIVSGKCTCLRFMLHPLKSSSSYECDGCNHHASFHSMENKTEDEIRKRWETEAKEKQAQEDNVNGRPRKRPRELEFNKAWRASGVNLIENGNINQDDVSLSGSGKTKAKATKAGGNRTTARAAATRARGKVTEIIDDDNDDLLELD